MINIAILGLGTVGYGVYDIVTKCDLDIKVKYVLEKDKSKEKLLEGNTILTTNYQDILEDPTVDTIVEVMGTKSFSYACIKEALIHKKNVVTANKEIIASYIDELTKLKDENNVSLYYEASVGGGIPIVEQLYRIVKINKVNKIYGILNGTTNFILTKMAEEGMELNEAIALAQQKGFAEADPTADLEGLDMVRKIAILSSIAYHHTIALEDIDHFGITNINKADVDYIKGIDYVLKLIAYSEYDEEKQEASILIEPVLVKNSILKTVSNENNIVSIDANINGNLKFYGLGAGRYPTANAICNDLIAINEKQNNYSFSPICDQPLQIKPLSGEYKYYIHLFKNEKIDEKIIEVQDGEFCITKPITKKQFNDNKRKIKFYARIMED